MMTSKRVSYVVNDTLAQHPEGPKLLSAVEECLHFVLRVHLLHHTTASAMLCCLDAIDLLILYMYCRNTIDQPSWLMTIIRTTGNLIILIVIVIRIVAASRWYTVISAIA